MGSNRLLRPEFLEMNLARSLYACSCGRLASVTTWRWIEAQAQPEELSRLLASANGVTELKCSGCGSSQQVPITVVVHDPRAESIYLLLAEAQRVQVGQEWSRYLALLVSPAASTGDPAEASWPAYFLRPHFVFGTTALRNLLEQQQDRRTEAERHQRLTDQSEQLLQMERALIDQESELHRHQSLLAEAKLQLEQVSSEFAAQQRLSAAQQQRVAEGTQAKEQELEALRAELVARELALASAQAAQTQRDEELAQRAHALELAQAAQALREQEQNAREQLLAQNVARLAAFEQERQRGVQELAAREQAQAVREQELSAGAQLGEQLRHELDEHERILGQQAAELAEKEELLRSMAQDLEHKTASLEQLIRDQEQREGGLENKARLLERLLQEMRLKEAEIQRREHELEDARLTLAQLEEEMVERERALAAEQHHRPEPAAPESSPPPAKSLAGSREWVKPPIPAILPEPPFHAPALSIPVAAPDPPAGAVSEARQLLDGLIEDEALDIEIMPGSRGAAPGQEVQLASPQDGLGPAEVEEERVLERLASDLPEQLSSSIDQVRELIQLDEMAEAGLPENAVPAHALPVSDPRLLTPALPPIRRQIASPDPTDARSDGDQVFLDDETWSNELDRAWDLEIPSHPTAPVPAPAPAPVNGFVSISKQQTPSTVPEADRPITDREPTRKVQISQIEEIMARDKQAEPRTSSQKGKRIGPFGRWSESLPPTATSHLTLREGEVYLCLRVSNERLAWIRERQLDLIPQLHKFEEGAAILLLLCASGPDGATEEVAHWLVDHRTAMGEEVLAALAFSFRPSVILFDLAGEPREQSRFDLPLEQNVTLVRTIARQWEESRKVDVPAVVRRVEQPAFDRLGRKQHPFRQAAFQQIDSPGQAKFATGVFDYWYQPENKEFLVLIKGYPLPELRNLTLRILGAALEFGIVVGPLLEQETIALGLARNPRDLCTHLLANFVEVSLKIKFNDLDELAEWENWGMLLERGEDVGLEIDEEVYQMAEQAMRRAQLLAEAQQGPSVLPSGNILRTTGLTPPVSEEPTLITRLDGDEFSIPASRGVTGGAARFVIESLPVVESNPPETEGPSRPAAVRVELPSREGSGPLFMAPAPPDRDSLIRMLDDEAMAHDAAAALAVLGRPAAEALIGELYRLEPTSPRIPRLVQTLAGTGLVALGVLAEELQKRKHPDSILDRCLSELIDHHGPELLEAESRRNLKLREVVKRALELSRQTARGPGKPGVPLSVESGGASRTEPNRVSRGGLSGSLESLLEQDRNRNSASAVAAPPALQDKDQEELLIDDFDIIEDHEDSD